MNKKIIFNPWLLLLQGALLLLLGILTLFNPGITLQTIIRIFGVVIMVTGIFLVTKAWKKEQKDISSSFWLFSGVIEIALGLLFLINPKLVVNVFFVFVGFIALAVGVFNFWVAWKRKTKITDIAMIKNFLTILFGLILLVNPFGSASAVTAVIGIFAIIYGAMTMISSISVLLKQKK